MKYLLIFAIVGFTLADTIIGGGTVGVGYPHHVGGVYGGLTDFNHDGIPD